ncbi:MAG: GNAT family N-acetyltransferase [Mycobacterium leprae]
MGESTMMRSVTMGDLPALQAWDEDPEIVALMGRKYEETNTADWFQSLRTERNCRAWMIETKEGRLIGELELAQLNWRVGSAELRICIGEKDCRSKGYGTDVIRSAMRVAFQGLQLHEVYLRVFTSNVRAVRVYERVGFRKKALMPGSDRRHDPSAVLLMSISREQWASRQLRTAAERLVVG